LSWVRGNSPAQFLGEGAAATPPPYPTKGRGKKRAKKEDKHKKEGLDQQESSTQEALF